MKIQMTDAAIKYTWDQIFYRLGTKLEDTLFKVSGKKIILNYANLNEIEIPSDQYLLQVLPCAPDAIEQLLNNPGLKLTWLSKKEFLPDQTIDFPFDKLPILFWGNRPAGFRFAEINMGNQLIVNVDLIASVFFMLSRVEEFNPKIVDKHGRYTCSASAAFRHGFMDLPIVDIYVKILKYWLEAVTNEKIPNPFQFKVSLSHDIDFISLFRPAIKGISTLARDTLKLNLKNIREDFRILKNSYRQDPYFSGIYFLAEKSAEFGFSSTFNVMATAPSMQDSGYSLASPIARDMFSLIAKQGHQIGLHTSYFSLEKPGMLAREKSVLEKRAGGNIDIVRSHFLRLKTPESWRSWQSTGFKRDTSYGFSEHEGFRCGTCFPYQPFDIEADKPLDIIEEPLIVMDTTLKSSRRLDYQEAREIIIRLAETCRFVGGSFTLLWHNTSFFRDWQDWGVLYPEILSSLHSMLAENQNI